MKNKVLLCFTTYNQLDMTRKCLEQAMELGFDILVIDDCSTDGTQEYLCQIRVNAILKNERKGLTDSWNRAYKYFKSSDYCYMVLSNNDVIIPVGAVEGMLSEYPLVVPMCNFDGAGYACKEQAIDFHIDVRNYDPVQADDADKIQNILSKGFKPAKCWTGFCMCMSCEIKYWEREDGNLFDTKNINVGNDDDLAKRINAYSSTYIALGAFVYHYKGTSFNKQISDRNNLNKDYA